MVVVDYLSIYLHLPTVAVMNFKECQQSRAELSRYEHYYLCLIVYVLYMFNARLCYQQQRLLCAYCAYLWSACLPIS